MKKIMILLGILFFLSACSKNAVSPKVEPQKEEKQEKIIEKYQDNNHTPISFYQLKGDTLTKIDHISGEFVSMDDIALLQIYPSVEDTISLTDNFARSFFQEWEKYNSNHSLKIGFSLSFVDKEENNISYTILSPSNTMDHWEYFMAYLYDDYVNLGKGFYSHLENDDYQDSTLFTSIKLQCGVYCRDIPSTIQFQVFTYDSEDDFLDNTYRGNSKSSLSICLKGTC